MDAVAEVKAGFAGRGVAFSAAEDSDILEGRAAGFTWHEIGVLLSTGRADATIAHRYRALVVKAEARAAAAHDAARARLRACLRCRESFMSAWAGNRLCAACGALATDCSAFEPD